MKLFVALALVANLHAPANAADLPGLRLNGITADLDLVEAAADADDVDASPHQDTRDNQADNSKSAVPKFLRGIQVGSGQVCTTTSTGCGNVTNGNDTLPTEQLQKPLFV
eukprot:scaffold5863_cov90-Skeletonema_dohrnii-CCMP3373.AAC.7